MNVKYEKNLNIDEKVISNIAIRTYYGGDINSSIRTVIASVYGYESDQIIDLNYFKDEVKDVVYDKISKIHEILNQVYNDEKNITFNDLFALTKHLKDFKVELTAPDEHTRLLYYFIYDQNSNLGLINISNINYDISYTIIMNDKIAKFKVSYLNNDRFNFFSDYDISPTKLQTIYFNIDDGTDTNSHIDVITPYPIKGEFDLLKKILKMID